MWSHCCTTWEQVHAWVGGCGHFVCCCFSIRTTWENVISDHADVKELIPEFYQPPGDFLVNSMVSIIYN